MRPDRFGLACTLALAAACEATDPAVPQATRENANASAKTEAREIVFERVQLSSEFTCEGATFADFDKDGHNDVVAGPWWYVGPDFKSKHELYEPKPFDPRHYSDHFFDWVRDFDGDGWVDLLVVGFPGKEAYWLRNPCGENGGKDKRWQRFPIAASVDNESPAYANLTGDGTPELVYMTGGRFGWAAADTSNPRKEWTFHAISEDFKLGPFVHGMGVGDINGDGRVDIFWKDGWYEQPASLANDPQWPFHAVKFTDQYGGAQMYAYDVDGDGDNDVITSLAAHHFGLSWFEQVKSGAEISFVEHKLMGAEPKDSPHGVRFGEIHAIDLGDVDGDGLLDIVAGKRWWSHSDTGDPEPGSKAVVYWFQLVRGPNGVDFVPHLADDESGVGVQVVSGDVDGDGQRDIVIGNKRGAFVLLQRRVTATERAALARTPPTLDFESGDLRGWTSTGNAFALQPVRGDTVTARGREGSLHEGNYWIGGYERVGDEPKGTLTSHPFKVEQPWASYLIAGGAYTWERVEVVLAGEDKVLSKMFGANFESMQRVVVDLRPYVGREIYLRLVDEGTGGWGHLNFDDFRFHAEEPHFVRPAGVPEIVMPDEVANAGLDPKAAAAAMTLPDGFHVDLIASEPDVHQPIALAIDDRGRLWVAEAFAYPKRAPGDKGPDDILVFEDADHDGTFEKRTVFIDGLNLISGLEVGFGGVWIGAAPYLMFVPDKDGDLVPDGPPEILLDGWAWQDTHETLNAFTWGPDGWLYGCHGVFTYSNVGKPGCADSERTPINAGVWRYHPTRHEFEVFAWGTSNPWGVDFDEHGQAFITACVIPHLYHMVQGGRFERQAGEHYDKYAFDDIKTIADHSHFVGGDSHAGNLRSNAVGGGHAHCGLMINLGDQWPAEYRGGLFFENIHGNRVNHDVVERQGSGFVGKHAKDLLISNDAWFRGVAFEQGPDGSMYFTDWYDKQACHLTDPQVWDRTNGRIYRVTYGKQRPVPPPDLSALTAQQLSERVGQGDEWTSRRLRRRLAEQGHSEAGFAWAVDVLKDGNGQSETETLREMWALHAIGGLGESAARTAMTSRHEYVRAWSIQLALEDKAADRETVETMEQMASNDASTVVRLYLASALQRLPVDQRWKIAQNLTAHGDDAKDHNIPLMLWYGIEPLVAADADRALKTFTNSPIEKLAHFVVRRAAADPRLHEALVRHLADPAQFGTLGWRLEEAAAALKNQRSLKMPAGWAELYPKLAYSSDSRVHEAAQAVAIAFGDPSSLPSLRKTLLDPNESVDARMQALDGLIRAKDVELAATLRALLNDPTLRGAAIRSFATIDDVESARLVLASYPQLGAEEKRDALNTLSSRTSYATLLVDAVEADAIARTDLGAFVVRKIETLNDPQLTERLQKIWGRVQETSELKKARIALLKSALNDEALSHASRPRGREVFSRTCQQCHTLFGTGGKVGPDLTGSNRADLDYLLSNVVDPNAVVGKDYLATLVWTNDGRLVTGIQRASTDSSITLQTENELIVVAREDIETSRVSDLSTMPEGLLETLKPAEIVDLVAYLRGTTQAPLAATPHNASRFFDGASLAGWSGNRECWSVEGSELVGRTTGLAKNEFLVSDLDVGDFKLALDVKLVGDAGNSGIQFRSEPLEGGEVRGYQADVGPGWWGKLYEEEGRALLWDRSGEAHVKKGEWNRYEIEARGHHVRTSINGQPCVDLDDAHGALRGQIALQLHSGGPTEVRFRNFELVLLDAASSSK